MATQNQVNIGINVSDNGTAKKTVKNFEEITKAANTAQNAASNINTPAVKSTMAPGGTSGSRRAAEPSGSQRLLDNQGYNSARGTAGATGAAGRDFANQAQGLGGLVRLYATLAANVFAASAAFSALKNAADTTNLVRGLDILGAASGQALGSLSKRLVEVTDGAISMREAMTATATASSAGMNSKNIERLGVVAKNASLALGVSMPDAINRLSRGIVKLEPELLDELGLFTKIGPATEKYALAIGKSANSLTDFERRQAFANAVLEEGEAKFGELASAAANPYDRLLASLKNVTQQALEVVNKILGPIVNLLASNPTALAGALAVLGTVLVRQAIPALTEFKSGLASAANAATEMAKSKAEDAKAARARIDKDIIAEVENRASKEIDAVDRAEKKIEQLRKAGYAKNTVAAKLLSQDLDDIRKEDLAKQDRIAQGLESKAKRLAADPSADPKAIQNAQKAAEANRLVVTTLTSAINAQNDFFNTEKRIIEQTEKAAKGRSIYGLTIQASLASQDAATKKNIVSNAAYNASLIGITGAFRLMNAEIAKSGLVLNIFQLGLLKAKAGVAMLIGVLGTLGAVVNGVLGAIGLIVAVVGIFDSVFSKASKEIDLFNGVLTKVDDAAANTARTLAHLDKKGGYATGTIDGINAMANAFVELASSAKEAVDSAALAMSKMGTWDKIKDKIFSAFGGGIEKNLAKALTKDVTSALDILTKSGLENEARETFKSILGVDSLDTESVNAAILKLSDSAKNKLVTALSDANAALNNSASRLQTFKSATEGTTRAYQDFIVSTANSNPIFKVGSSLETLARTMESVATGGVREMEAAMISLAESPEKGMLFGGQFTTQLVALRKGFLDQNSAVTAYTNRLQDLDKQIEETSASMDNLQEGTKERTTAGLNLAQLKKDKDVIVKTIDLLPRDKIVAARDLFNKGIDNAFTEGSRLISVGLGQAAEKAAQTIAKANLGGLSGGGLAREQLRIDQKDIDIQIRAIDTNIGLILSQERLRASIDQSNAVASLAQAKQDKKPQEVIARLEAGVLASQGLVTLLGQSGTPNLTGTKEQLSQRAGITDNQDASRILASQALGLNSQLSPQLAARKEQQGAKTASNITGVRAITQGDLQDLQKTQSLQQAINKEEITRLGILNSITGISSKNSVIQQNMLEMDQLATRQTQEQQNINLAIANAASDPERQKQKEYKVLILARQEEELRNLFLQNRQKVLQTEIEQIGRRTELERSGAELQNTLASIALDTQSQELALYSSAYNISREIQISQQADLDIRKAQLETTTAVAAAEAALQQKREEAQARLNLLGEGEGVRAKEITDELARQTTLTQNTVAGLTAQGAAKTSILSKTREINLEQERYNQLVTQTESLGQSLAAVFGNVGTAIGDAVKSMVSLAKTQQDNDKRILAAKEELAKYEETDNSDAKKKAIKDLTKAEKLRTITEIDGMAQVAGNTKKVFKEKTAAYKAFATVEKTLHVISMAMKVKEMIQDGISLASKIATNSAGMTSDVIAAGVAGVKSVVSAIQGPFPMNVIAGAATAAVVAGLLSSIGGKGPSVSGGFVPTAEQRQETQGTAMGYNSEGAKVQVRRGVFGDENAKSESIANSLEIIRDNSVEGLDYDDKMLRSLQNLTNALDSTAQGLYGIKGLRAGSLSGVVEGTNTSGGLLGIGGLFSKSTSKSIIDSGLQLKGTFLELVQGLQGTINTFETVSTTVKRSGVFGIGGSTKTYVDTEFKDLGIKDPKAFKALVDAFGYASDLLYEVADTASKDADAVTAAMSKIRVDQMASLRGLTGEQFTKELSAVIGSVLDETSLVIFAEYEKFAKFGEGMLETVIRVVDTNRKVIQQLENLGNLSVVNLSIGISSMQITENLANLAGGLDKFLDQTNYFRDNFLTEAERVIPTQKAVVKQLNALGYASVDTKAEFKALVQSLDLTNDNAQKTYQSLMDLAPGFMEVIDAVEAQSQALKDSASNFRDFIVQIREFKNSLLLGASSTLTPSQKYAEAKNQFDAIYAQALGGDAVAMGKVTSSAQTFLEASKTYFASSTAYTNDFNTVLSKLDAASVSAGASASVAELQLSALSVHTTLLTSINANIATIAGVPQAAGGGRVRGLTLVGELGPELVDFTNPGQVYTAEQTAGMFAPKAGVSNNMNQVVQELRQVRQEIAQLRKDQQQQTGDLIVSNYDANNRAAEVITTEVANTATLKEWQQRNKVAVV